LQEGAEVGLTLQAANPALASEKAQVILLEMGGGRIVRTRLGEEEIVTAELNPQRIPELIGRLNEFGEIKGKPPLPQLTAASVSIRLEISQK
jgi:hypothetical protein